MDPNYYTKPFSTTLDVLFTTTTIKGALNKIQNEKKERMKLFKQLLVSFSNTWASAAHCYAKEPSKEKKKN